MTGLIAGLGVITAAGIWALWAQMRGQQPHKRRNPRVTACQATHKPPARVPPAQPAPGPSTPQPGRAGIHRGPVMRIDMWGCGCMWTYTPETGWAQEIDCLDERLRRLLTP